MFRTGFVGRQFPSGLGAGSSTGPMTSLDLNFMSGTLDSRITFTRASTATYFDNTGTMQNAGTNVPRFDYDPVSLQMRGLLIEESRTNSVKNGSCSGAVAGTPGTLPTGWTTSLGGLTQQVVATGTESGIPYVDIRFSGTTTAASFNLNFGAVTDIAAANGQSWTESFYVKQTAGSLANITTVQMIQQYYDSTPTFLNANIQTITLATTGALGTCRQTYPVTIAIANTAYDYPYMKFNSSIGVVIDITIRVGGVQLEQGAFATSYIPTTAAAVTRQQDNASISVSSWYNTAVGSWALDWIPEGINTTVASRLVGWTNSRGAPLMITVGGNPATYDGSAQLNGTGTATVGTVNKMASSWQPGTALVGLNGGSVSSASNLTSGFPNAIGYKFLGDNTPSDQANGWVQRVRYWPRALAAGEIQQVTAEPTLDIDFRAPTIDPRITFTRASSGSFFDSTGMLTTVGNNVPRLDYDKDTLQPRGLLVEEARTNSIRNSVAAGFVPGIFGSGGLLPSFWNISSAANLAAVISNPGVINGIQCVDLRFFGTPTTTFIVFTGEQATVITAAPGDVWTVSWYAAVVGGSLVGINSINVNLRFQGDGVPVVPMAGINNVLTRYSGTQTAGASTTNVQPAVQIATQVGVPIDFTIRVGAPQCELGAFATSYIPTSGAAATRAAEMPTILVGPWINPNAVSYIAEAMQLDPNSGAANTLCQFDDTTNNNRSLVTRNSASNIQYFESNAAATTANVNHPNSLPNNTAVKAGVATIANSHQVAVNGDAPTGNTNATGPAAYTTLRFGRGLSPAAGSGSHYVRRVRVWPRQLSNAELTVLTT